MALTSPSKVTQTPPPVKSLPPGGTGATSDSMIHHNVPGVIPRKLIVSYKSIERAPYGVSQSRRILSPQILLKKFDRIRDCLEDVVGLSTAQREVVLRLLRFWAYYSQVYPKQAQVSSEPGCSKATYWRTVRQLSDRGLIEVINRYVVRPHAQISNLYRLDRLVLLLARYLAEHGCPFREKWLEPYLSMPGRLFWSIVYQTPEARAGPGGLAS